MNRFILIFTGIFLFALTTPALSLTLQERMNLIKQKELQRKEQIKSEHDKKRASQLAIKVEPDDSTSVFVSNGGTEITKNNTNETSKKNQLGIVTAIAADQVWEYRLTGWVHRILINKVEGNKISVFYTATDKYNNTSASLLDGDYVAEQGTFVLTLTAFIKKRLSYQLSGKLLNGRLVAEVDTGRGQRQWTYNLNKTNQFEESFYRYRTFYQKRKKQKEIEKYYKELVITPEVDEYGVKTFATMKLEYEKKFLRPLTDKEIETLKQNRVNAVQSAISRKTQQDEQIRLAKVKKKQEIAKQRRLKAEISTNEGKKLMLFNEFNLADIDIDRDEFKEAVIKAGGQFLSPEKQLVVLGSALNEPGIDVFVTSSLLPGTTFGFAQYITKEKLFGNDEVLATFGYMLDQLTSENLMVKISNKYGPPSKQGKNNMVWSRDSGKSSLMVEMSQAENLFAIPSVMLIYTNIENMKQLNSKEKVQSQKKQSNF